MVFMASSAALEIRRDTQSASRFAWVVLGSFIFVVLWGAVVRASGSGGGCGANWPLCNGDFVPHHPRLATIIEFTHRSTSGICTFLLAALASWTFAVTPRGHRARRAVLWSVALLIVEAFLGALLVLRGWVENNISNGRVVAQSIHFTNTMLLMAALALTAWFLRRPTAYAPRPATAPSTRGAAILAIIATIFVGATGSLAALADTLFPSSSVLAGLTSDFAAGSPLLVRMRWFHPAAAVIGVVCVLLMVRAEARAENSRTIFRGISGFVLATLLLQFVLGIADVLLLAPTWMQVVHLLGADVYWIALVILAAQSLWPPQPATSPL
jgi:cytochrome c oxidase assembly protein subunit 15